MKLPSNVRFLNPELKKAFYELEKGNDSERELSKFINQAMNNIEDNAFCGIQIPKRLIPREYKTKHNLKNIWKYDLPRGWRLMYSIVGEDVVIVALIIEWLNHKEYEKRFKY